MHTHLFNARSSMCVDTFNMIEVPRHFMLLLHLTTHTTVRTVMDREK